MHMEMTLKNNKNRIINILILFIAIILFFILFILKIKIPCMFKSILGISCAGCGMTRAINELLHFNLVGAFNYNMLSIPLVITCIISFFSIIYDIIKNTSLFINMVNKAFTKYWYIILTVVFITFVINNLK